MCQIGFFAVFGIYGINAIIARFSEGPLALWHWPLLVVGSVLCFLPLDLMSNVIGSISVSIVAVLTHRRNELFCVTPS